MNTQSNVISAPVAVDLSVAQTFAAGDGGREHIALKMTSTGVAPATVGAPVIGTLYRANMAPAVGQSAVGMACDVFIKGWIHYVQLGATSAALNSGDIIQLDPANAGQYIPASGGSSTAIVWEAAPTTFQGAIIRALV